jgi:hypothetical protein
LNPFLIILAPPQSKNAVDSIFFEEATGQSGSSSQQWRAGGPFLTFAELRDIPSTSRALGTLDVGTKRG